jgi:hypothetical protein
MTKKLPARPSLNHLKHQARNLERGYKTGDAGAIERVRAGLPGHEGRLSLAKAQTVIAREYGEPSWQALKTRVEEILRAAEQAEAGQAPGYTASARKAAIEAVKRCDRDALAELLERHPRLNELRVSPHAGTTLLHEACAVDPATVGRSTQDLIAVIDLLLDSGLDVRTPLKLPDGGTLSVAWFCRIPEVLEYVLERGADPNGCLFAAAYGNGDADGIPRMRLLQRFGANLEEVAYDETPLLHALKSRKLQSTRALLELGANVNFADSQGVTALHYAIRQYHEPEVIALLLEHGASPALASKRGVTPLDLAVRMGRRDVAQMLGAGRSGQPTPGRPVSKNVTLIPFLNIDEAELRELVDWYQRLSFQCENLQLDHSFAKLALQGAQFMVSGGGNRDDLAGETLVYRCPAEVFETVRATLEQLGITQPSDAEQLAVTDRSGFRLRFLCEPERHGVALRSARVRALSRGAGPAASAGVPARPLARAQCRCDRRSCVAAPLASCLARHQPKPVRVLTAGKGGPVECVQPRPFESAFVQRHHARPT